MPQALDRCREDTHVELADYSDLAVRLVNTEQPGLGEDTLTSVAAVRRLVGPGRPANRATEADVSRLKAVRTRLRAVFTAAWEGDELRAVDLLNALLMEYPASPQISRHAARTPGGSGGGSWHLHLADQGVTAGTATTAGSATNTAAGYTALACTGLAFHLTGWGVDRLGICGAEPCRNAFVDTSTNRSRRYCSDRCATRANVAAYRARKRLGLASGRTAAGTQRSTETTGRFED